MENRGKYDLLDFDRDSLEWESVYYGFRPHYEPDDSDDEVRSVDHGKEREVEREIYALDCSGMTAREKDFELKAASQGFCCVFCKRFHCPASFNAHIPPEYRLFFAKEEHIYSHFASGIHKKHLLLAHNKTRTRTLLHKKYREYMKSLAGRTGQVSHSGLPFCVHWRVESDYGKKCKDCAQSPCMFLSHLKHMMGDVQDLLSENEPASKIRGLLNVQMTSRTGLVVKGDYGDGKLPKCVPRWINKIFSNKNFPERTGKLFAVLGQTAEGCERKKARNVSLSPQASDASDVSLSSQSDEE